jgi:hypothetical protein
MESEELEHGCIQTLSNYTHAVLHEKVETCAIHAAMCMINQRGFNIAAIPKLVIMTSLDKMVQKYRGMYQKWYEDQEQKIKEIYVTTGFEDYVTIFEVPAEVSMQIDKTKKIGSITRLHWSIYSDVDATMPSMIAYRAMSNYDYALRRFAKGCPIATRLLKNNGTNAVYRRVDELANDDVTNMIFLISDPKWMWRTKKSKKTKREREDEEEDDTTEEDDEMDKPKTTEKPKSPPSASEEATSSAMSSRFALRTPKGAK